MGWGVGWGAVLQWVKVQQATCNPRQEGPSPSAAALGEAVALW